ncbi:ribosomal rRNA-processing protein 9 [Sporothrix brasiliensis 5110]|uniref:Ribosomal rRNA-processing protein 9 n=1 Tax=Sporothrix brasiliensis 5110 TaxID=1398154 RepID=A0A0C2IMX8_9PEZI|nr:ribosomal rRNA-processing protein 9 [Sporothrix brasiliensis 5110]KIH88370.1 ribosomal rRNA-processing protein 9 [Sporothrix brasiliensis 5110]
MSSFFTVPGSQKKRKRATAPEAPKKRAATTTSSSKASGASRTAHGASGKQKTARSRDAADSASASTKSGKKPTARSRKEAEEEDESVSGSDSDDDEYNGRPRGGRDSDDAGDDDDDSDGDEGETAAERRLRLAERYLENVKTEVKGAAGADGDIYAFDAEDVDRDLIAERLQEDVAEAKGRVYRQLAGKLGFALAGHCLLRWNAKNVNAVAVCAPYAYTVSSDVYLIKWRVQDRPDEQRRQREESRRKWEEERNKNKNRKRSNKKKQEKKNTEPDEAAEVPARKQPQRVLFRRGNPARRKDKDYRGHVGAILCVAASQDGRFVVTGGADRRMVVWDAHSLKPLRVFTHHRDAVTGLAFRRGTNQLYSCSKDRTIKIWSLDELAYVQTLFGHQDEITDIDALAQEKCVSVGTRDRTARMWKVVEETQLVFRGGGTGGKGSKNGDGSTAVDPNSLAHEGSMDRVAMLDDELFVTGSDNGALALWSTQKKKPLHVVPRAHGLEPVQTHRDQYDAVMATPAAQAANPPPPPQPRWITALRTIPYSDIVFSGSWDGCVRVWCLSKDKRKLEPLGVLGVNDSSNALSTSTSSSPSKSTFSIPGVVNDIAAFERGERGRDGLSIVVAVGQEHRLGRWGRQAGARNGAVVFEVGRLEKYTADGVNGVNGHANGASDDEEEQ